MEVVVIGLAYVALGLVAQIAGFILSRCGGVDLLKSRGYAERLHTDEWRQFVARTAYGPEPEFSKFETPAVLDSVGSEISLDTPSEPSAEPFRLRSRTVASAQA